MKSCMKIALVAGCAMAAVASAKPPLQVSGPGVKIDPVRIAKVKKDATGKVTMLTDWIAYDGFANRAIPSGCLFDCFGRDWSIAATGAPENPSGCIANGSRWFFGTTALNNNWLDDMTSFRKTTATELDIGWSWNVAAPTQLFIFYFLSTGGDLSVCDETGAGLGNGIVLDFGVTAPGAGYYYSNVDMTSFGGLVLDATVTGYQGIIGEAFDGTTITLAAGPCQPMLWGATENLRAEGGADILPGSYGNQGEATFDDDAPNDGAFDNTVECYTYDFGSGLCARPLGKMVAFGGCSADFDGDGFPTGDDFDAFVVQFELGDLAADFDGDGFVTGDDFDAYVALFELGC